MGPMPADPDPTVVTSDLAGRDPWAEQARRRHERRRRRAIRWLVALAGVLLAVWIGVAVGVLAGRSDADPSADAVPSGGSTPVPGSEPFVGRAPSGSLAPAPPAGSAVQVGGRGAPAGSSTGPAPDRPGAASYVEVAEVWLLGHEDGTVDWGAIVESIAADDRGPIKVDARFRDATGAAVASRSETLQGLAAGGRAVVGGSLPAMEPVPARVQVEVSVGRPLDASAFDGSGIEVRSLDRRTRADGGEELSGFVVSERESAESSLRLALLWRDPDGSVVGSVFRNVAALRPGAQAHFTVPLSTDTVPEGLPTEAMWTRLAAGP